MRKLLRDGIAFGFDKVLRDHHLYQTHNTTEEDELFTALRSLVELAALLLMQRVAVASAQQPTAAAMQILELDGELLQLISLVAAMFNKDTPLLEYHTSTEMPMFLDDDVSQYTYRWAHPIPAPSGRGGLGQGRRGDDMADEGEDEVLFEDGDREHEWLVHLINHFGESSGFPAVVQVSGGNAAGWLAPWREWLGPCINQQEGGTSY